MSPEQIASNMEFMLMYRDNLLVRILITASEVFPPGLIVSLISALILKKNPIENA